MKTSELVPPALPSVPEAAFSYSTADFKESRGDLLRQTANTAAVFPSTVQIPSRTRSAARLQCREHVKVFEFREEDVSRRVKAGLLGRSLTRLSQKTSLPELVAPRVARAPSGQKPQQASDLQDAAIPDSDQLDPFPSLDQAWPASEKELDFQINAEQQASSIRKVPPSAFPSKVDERCDLSALTETRVLRPSDRRAHPRRESTCTVSLCAKLDHFRTSPQSLDWLLHSDSLKGKLLDVSMSGLALQLPTEIAPETAVWLRLSNRKFARNVDAGATVLRCTDNGDGWWNVVCRLDKRLTFEQIHQVGQHLFSSTIV